MRTETLWYLIAAGFFIVAAVGGLGEYVFHWWQDPWNWATWVSLALGVFAVAWGASSKDLRRTREDLHEEVQAMRGELREGSGRLEHGQANQTEALQELTQAVRGLSRGQEEQTSLLREVVASFRR